MCVTAAAGAQNKTANTKAAQKVAHEKTRDKNERWPTDAGKLDRVTPAQSLALTTPPSASCTLVHFSDTAVQLLSTE